LKSSSHQTTVNKKKPDLIPIRLVNKAMQILIKSMYHYLLINLAILAFPFALSFEKRLKYYSKFKSLIPAIMLVGGLYVAWDAFATFRGHWSFNPSYVLGTKLLGLPFEEILFFLTVPYSCIFAYEGIVYFLKEEESHIKNRILPAVVGLGCLLSAFLFLCKEYTFLALLSVGLTLLFIAKVNIELFWSKRYWVFIGFAVIVFLIFNFLLTSLPIVEYSALAITGIRVLTIPIEDFMFNFSMLTLYLAAYLWFSKRL
jgi:lycopene cyclase domain-containing protein